jgi:thiol-disulfide isomerase/thioredoxin
MGIRRWGILACIVILLCVGCAWARPVTVTVCSADTGRAIAGAVIVRLEPDRWLEGRYSLQSKPVFVGLTDASGKIALDCDPADRSAFLVTAPGWATQPFGFWGCVPREQRVRLEQARGELSGRMIDAAGKPITNAPLRLYVEDFDLLTPVHIFADAPGLSYPIGSRTDAEGRFAVPFAPRGAVAAIEVEIAGHWHSISNAVIGDAGFLVADQALREGSFVGRVSPDELPPSRPVRAPGKVPTLTLHLRVVDARTHLPIPRVRVSPGGDTSPDQFARTLSQSALELPGDDIRWSFYDGAWEYFLRVEADGYAAAPTRMVKASEKSADLELAMTKSTPISIAVKNPDGRPAGGAVAYLATPTILLNVPLATVRADGSPEPVAVAGTDGIIHLNPPGEPYRLAIFDSAGSCEFSPDDAGKTITLTPWASVHLDAGSLNRPIRHAYVESQSGYSEELKCPIDWGATMLADDRGQLDISRCRPGSVLLFVEPSTDDRAEGWNYAKAQNRLKPDEHWNCSLLGGSTTVRAALTEYPGYRWSTILIEPRGPWAKLPADVNRLAEKPRENAILKTMKAACLTNNQTREGGMDTCSAFVSADGSIGVRGLNSGTYCVTGFAEKTSGMARPGGNPGRLEWYFSIPADAPSVLDLGVMSPTSLDVPALQVGQSVPDLDATALDGRHFSLRACRGKWVLLDFWGTWCGVCVAEEPTLKDAQEGWARDGRLAMVSASVDDTVEQVRQHVKEHELNWTQIVLGPRGQTTVPQKFAVDGYPTILLISPEGKLVETGLRGGRVREALMKYIGPPSPPPATK